MSNITQFTNRADVQLTDKAVGHRGTADGADSGWTFLVIKNWILSYVAPLTHVADVGNPHVVTKAQVGLGNANDTADSAKPVSVAQAAANAAVAAAAAGNLTTHANRVDNPHVVTKAQVGLSAVDNTSDADKPISVLAAAQFLLRLTAASPLAAANLTGTINPARLAAGTGLQILRRNATNTGLEFVSLALGGGDLVAANNLSELPSKATARTNLLLGNVDNTADMAKPVSTAQAAADAAVLAASAAQLALHAGIGGNPHGTTKADIAGLDQVDNTSDVNKPVSTAQAAADAAVTAAAGASASAALTAALSAHVQPANQISGVVPMANLAAGIPDGTKFVRDDGTLAVPAGTGGGGGGSTDLRDVWLFA